jgi:hypothetical protein
MMPLIFLVYCRDFHYKEQLEAILANCRLNRSGIFGRKIDNR